jgi:hypothetical protein
MLVLALALAGQLAWHGLAPAPRAAIRELPPAPSPQALRLAALGEPATLAAGGVLWLQFFDEQPGVSVPFRELDYARVRAWLGGWLALAPESAYPLVLAVRMYGQVADPARQRVMFDFVETAFVEDPRARWRWLAEAAVLAEHRLDDRELALGYARALARHTRPGEIPHWARDLQILILEDLGEYEAARILIGGLLASGALEDPHEIRFLERRLEKLEQRNGEKGGD